MAGETLAPALNVTGVPDVVHYHRLPATGSHSIEPHHVSSIHLVMVLEITADNSLLGDQIKVAAQKSTDNILIRIAKHQSDVGFCCPT